MTIILDSNLLLLLVVGLASRDYVETHKRLKSYSKNDFDLLSDTLAGCRIVVTPNVLTEASNLASQIAEPARTHIFEVFRAVIGSDQIAEKMVKSESAAARPEFLRLGLTDCALLELAEGADVLLTADVHLYLSALADGKRAENFNHMRSL